jgi:hypothetical protein
MPPTALPSLPHDMNASQQTPITLQRGHRG